jgi:hypothetical protein
MKIFILYWLVLCLITSPSKAQEAIHAAVIGNGMRVSNPTADQNNNLVTNFPNFFPGQQPFVYPNPATDRLFLVLSTDARKIYKVTFYDGNKKVLSEQEYPVEAGRHDVSIVLPSYDPAVSLLLRVEESGTSTIETFRIFRQ